MTDGVRGCLLIFLQVATARAVTLIGQLGGQERVDDVKTIYCLPVRWGPGLSWGDSFRTPRGVRGRQPWGQAPRERLECSGSCLSPVCLEVLVGSGGGAGGGGRGVGWCLLLSGQGIAWSDLEFKQSGPQFELLLLGEAEKENRRGGKSHPCPLRLNVGPRELSFETYA